MFPKARLLDILKNFICFSGDAQKPIKILAGYHQYFAVRKAVEKAVVATSTDGKGGVLAHAGERKIAFDGLLRSPLAGSLT